MDPLAIFTAIIVLIILLVLIYIFVIKKQDAKTETAAASTVPTTTTNGYISGGTITPILALPVTISGVTYINYTNTVPFSVVGTSTLDSVTTAINIPSVTTYTVSATNVSVVISIVPPTTTTDGYISNGIIVPIKALPVIISGATYINYSNSVPFSVTGSVTTKGAVSQINVSNKTSYTVSGDYIIASLNPNTILTKVDAPLTADATSIVSSTPIPASPSSRPSAAN